MGIAHQGDIIKVEKIKVLIMQLVLLVAILVLWEVLANKGVISTFLFSKPSDIYKLFIKSCNNNPVINGSIVLLVVNSNLVILFFKFLQYANVII